MKRGLRFDIQQEFAAFQKAYGATVKELRLQARMSRKTLAQKAQVNDSVLARIEQGCGNPGIGKICKIADALGKSVSRIFELAQNR